MIQTVILWVFAKSTSGPEIVTATMTNNERIFIKSIDFIPYVLCISLTFGINICKHSSTEEILEKYDEYDKAAATEEDATILDMSS